MVSSVTVIYKHVLSITNLVQTGASFLQQTKAFNSVVEIQGIWNKIKHMVTSIILNFGLTSVYFSIHK